MELVLVLNNGTRVDNYNPSGSPIGTVTRKALMTCFMLHEHLVRDGIYGDYYCSTPLLM